MKTQAKTQRTKRYEKRSKKYRQNQMLANNRKNSSETLVKYRCHVKNRQNKEQHADILAQNIGEQ